MSELWLPSGGVNRKQKELWLPQGGVNRKLKELYAVSGGVNRKIFSGGIPYTLTASQISASGNIQSITPYVNADGSGEINIQFTPHYTATAVVAVKCSFDNIVNSNEISLSNDLLMDCTGFSIVGPRKTGSSWFSYYIGYWNSSTNARKEASQGYSAPINTSQTPIYEGFSASKISTSVKDVALANTMDLYIQITIAASPSEDATLEQALTKISWGAGILKVYERPITAGPAGYLQI